MLVDHGTSQKPESTFSEGRGSRTSQQIGKCAANRGVSPARLSARGMFTVPGVETNNRKELPLLWKRLTEREAECARLHRQLSIATSEHQAECARHRKNALQYQDRLKAQVAITQKLEIRGEELRQELSAALGLSPNGSPRGHIGLKVNECCSARTATPMTCTPSDEDAGTGGSWCEDGMREATSADLVVYDSTKDGILEKAEEKIAEDCRSLNKVKIEDEEVLRTRLTEWARGDTRLSTLRARSNHHRQKARQAACRLFANKRKMRGSWRRLRNEQEELLAWRSELAAWWVKMSNPPEASSQADKTPSFDDREREQSVDNATYGGLESMQDLENPAVDGDFPQCESSPSETLPEQDASLKNCSKDSRRQAKGATKRKKSWLHLRLRSKTH